MAMSQNTSAAGLREDGADVVNVFLSARETGWAQGECDLLCRWSFVRVDRDVRVAWGTHQRLQAFILYSAEVPATASCLRWPSLLKLCNPPRVLEFGLGRAEIT